MVEGRDWYPRARGSIPAGPGRDVAVYGIPGIPGIPDIVPKGISGIPGHGIPIHGFPLPDAGIARTLYRHPSHGA